MFVCVCDPMRPRQRVSTRRGTVCTCVPRSRPAPRRPQVGSSTQRRAIASTARLSKALAQSKDAHPLRQLRRAVIDKLVLAAAALRAAVAGAEELGLAALSREEDVAALGALVLVSAGGRRHVGRRGLEVVVVAAPTGRDGVASGRTRSGWKAEGFRVQTNECPGHERRFHSAAPRWLAYHPPPPPPSPPPLNSAVVARRDTPFIRLTVTRLLRDCYGTVTRLRLTLHRS